MSGIDVEGNPICSCAIASVKFEDDESYGAQVQWSIPARDPGVMLEINPETGNLWANPNTVLGRATIRASNEFDYIDFDYDLASACVNCVAGAGKAEAKGVDFSISLGGSRTGNKAGSLYIHSESPASNLGTPAALKLSVQAADQQVIQARDRTVLQVLSANSFADIVPDTATRYAVNLYSPSAVGAKGTNGLFAVSGQPQTSWVVEDLDNNPAACTQLRMTRDGGDEVFDYTFDAQTSTWSLQKGAGLRTDSARHDGNTVTNLVKNASGGIEAKSVELYQDFAWGRELVQEQVFRQADDANPLTTTRTYANARLAGIVNPNGSWTRYEYDGQGRITQAVESWLDAAANAPANQAKAVNYGYAPVDGNDNGTVFPEEPRTETVAILGITVSKQYHAHYTNAAGDRVHVEEACSSAGATYGASGALRTVTTYYRYQPNTTNLPWAGKVKEIRSPDGRMDTHAYAFGSWTPQTREFQEGAGAYVRQRVTHGLVTAPDGVANKTTMDEVVTDAQGNSIYQAVYVFTGSTYSLVSWSAQTFDTLGRLTQTMGSDGAVADQTWTCCGLGSRIGADGSETRFAYDALHRPTSKTFEAAADIVTTYTYDAPGRVTSERVGADSLSLVTTNEFDMAGQLLLTISPAGLESTFDYAQNGRLVTATRPDTGTEIVEKYPDGKLKSFTGTGVVPRYYEYGINQDGSQWSKVYTGASNSPVWEKATLDILGRLAKTEKPGVTGTLATEFFFNSIGQLVKTTTTGQPDVLMVYDSLGNRIRFGMDLDQDEALNLAGEDRITDSESQFVSVSNAWWLESVSRIYPDLNSARPLTNSLMRTKLSGLSGGVRAVVSAFDVKGNESISTTTVDRENKQITKRITLPDSTQDVVSIVVNGLEQERTGQTGKRIVYSYDALARIVGTTDPRIGESVVHYDNAGRVDWTQDAANNRTSYAFDDAGRLAVVADPQTNQVRFAYNLLGSVVRKWGSGVYPVEQEFDSFGRRTAIKTFRSAADWSSATWPETPGTPDTTQWGFDPATSLVTNKMFADASHIQYAYTTDGKLSARVWARLDNSTPITTGYAYNDAGEVIGIDYSDATPDVTFAFDRLGRKTNAASSVSAHAFAYTDLDLISETIVRAGTTNVIDRSHDTLGRTTGFSVDSAYSVAYGFDGLGRFSSVSSSVASVSSVVQYSYLANADLLSGLSASSSQVSNFQFQVSRSYEDHRNLLTQIRNSVGTNDVSQFDYVNDSLSRRIARNDSGLSFLESVTTNAFGYNTRSELVSAGMGTNAYAYAYDPIGNLLGVTNNGASSVYTANALNQYTAISNLQSETTIAYDPDGNTTNNGRFVFTWDAENRLVTATPIDVTNGAVKVENTYDFMSRRIGKSAYAWSTNSESWLLTSESRFLYDNWNLISELITDNGSLITNSYVWGLDLSGSLQGAGGVGGLLSASFGGTTSVSSVFYCHDGNGNVTDLITDNGEQLTILAHYEYSAYGDLLVSSGPMANANPFRFSTKYFDAELGLYYYGYRFFDIDTQRWLSRDPLGEDGGLNLNVFCGNDGIGSVDAFGLWNLWSPGTWGVRNGIGWSLADSLNPLHESAAWAGAAKGAMGGGSIYANTMTFGLTDSIGVTDSGQYSGSEYAGAHVAARITRSLEIGLATYGTMGILGAAAAEGSTAAQLAYAGGQATLAIMAADSAGQNFGEASVEWETGQYGWAALHTGLGFADVLSARAGGRALKNTACDLASKSAIRVGTTKSEAQILLNQSQGALGEAAVRQRLLNSSTVDLVGEQVRITTPGVGQYRVTDFLVRGRTTGQMRIIEVKTGGATRDATQLAKDALIANPSVPTTFTGSRAAAAGFPAGTPTGPIRTFEVNASNLTH